MEAKRHPRNVAKKVNIKNVIFKEHGVPVFAGADLEFGAPNRQTLFQNPKDTGRKLVRQARRALNRAKETQERAKRSREAAEEHR